MSTERRLVLKDVHGMGEEFTILDGVDTEGKLWVFRRRSSNTLCKICGRTITDGWQCFDDGSAVCNDHVTITGKMT